MSPRKTKTDEAAEQVTEQVQEDKKKTTSKKKENKLTLPRYLRLAKGGMWKDTEGDMSSGKVVYAFDKVMVGRNPHEDDPEVQLDKHNNQDLREYGFIDQQLPWFIDLTNIPTEKLGRIIIAYKAGVLVRADPDNPPAPKMEPVKNEWKTKKDGALVFDGKNKEMFKKLQNLNYEKLKLFVNDCPLNEVGRDNLLDLFDYEKRGFNPLSRPRLEVLDMIRGKLKEYGPGMTGIRRNEDDSEK
jgi:hypothetical protein